MRVEAQLGAWIIARDWAPPYYFCFLVDSDKATWSRYTDRAMKFNTRVVAEQYATALRKRAKAVRESHPGFSNHKPKPLEQYRWSAKDKKLLVKMFALGCKPEAMAVQFGRTASACRSMYHLILKGGGS